MKHLDFLYYREPLMHYLADILDWNGAELHGDIIGTDCYLLSELESKQTLFVRIDRWAPSGLTDSEVRKDLAFWQEKSYRRLSRILEKIHVDRVVVIHCGEYEPNPRFTTFREVHKLIKQIDNLELWTMHELATTLEDYLDQDPHLFIRFHDLKSKIESLKIDGRRDVYNFDCEYWFGDFVSAAPLVAEIEWCEAIDYAERGAVVKKLI